MTSPEDERSGPLYASTPRRAPEAPAPPTPGPTPAPGADRSARSASARPTPPPPGPSGFYQEPDQPTYETLYRDIYGEAAPRSTSPAEPLPAYPLPTYPLPPGQPYPQQPDHQFASGATFRPSHPGEPLSPWQTLYPAGMTPPRDYGLARGLTAVGFLGVAGLQYFYIGKIGKGVAYLLTAGWFGIGTLVSMFTIGDEVVRTNDERRRGLR